MQDFPAVHFLSKNCIFPEDQCLASTLTVMSITGEQSYTQVMALGDGENDIEMLKLAGWGVAMANGALETKAVANALTGSNKEDGAAQAIHKYILS